MKNILAIFAVAVSALLASVAADAAEHEVKMLNKSAEGIMVLEPDVMKVAPGDSVHFVAAENRHNVESLDGMMPEGAPPFKGEMNKDVTVTLDKLGVYGSKCEPHYGMGMVGLIVVGMAVNKTAAAVVEQTGKAKQKFEEL
jgi:pseudoazurin